MSLFVPFLAWLINIKLKPTAQLSVGTLHQFTFLIQEPLYNAKGELTSQCQTAHTQSIIIKNTGKDTATNIEAVINWKTIINIWPIRSYEEKSDKDGRYIMIFNSLSPKEEIRVELLSINKDLPALITVRANECIGQNILMNYYPVVPVWKVRILVTLAFFGLAAAIYSGVIFIQFLVLKTPIVL